MRGVLRHKLISILVDFFVKGMFGCMFCEFKYSVKMLVIFCYLKKIQFFILLELTIAIDFVIVLYYRDTLLPNKKIRFILFYCNLK